MTPAAFEFFLHRARTPETAVSHQTGKLLKTRKQAVMAVRLLVLVILVLTLLCHAPGEAPSYLPLLFLGLFGVSNVLFWLVRRARFESRRSYSLILLYDAGMVSVLTLLPGGGRPEFLTVFLLTVLGRSDPAGPPPPCLSRSLPARFSPCCTRSRKARGACSHRRFS